MIKPENYLRDPTKMSDDVLYLADTPMYVAGAISAYANAHQQGRETLPRVAPDHLNEFELTIASLEVNRRSQEKHK